MAVQVRDQGHSAISRGFCSKNLGMSADSRRAQARSCACATLLVLPAAHADYLDDIGYRALLVQLGGTAPNGASIRIDQIEAPIGGGESDPIYRANPNNAGFSGVTFHDQTGGPNPLFSGHATGVALLFAGNAAMTPGVSDVDSYEANDWLNAVLFNDGVGLQRPVTGTGVLGNHSWVGSTTDIPQAADILQRLDWLIETSNYAHVVGVNNASNTLLSHAYNVIGVTLSTNITTQTTAAIDTFYVAGRPLPHLAAPRNTVSDATPVVTSAAALLVDSTVANSLPAEVVKALLMAGADRITRNTATSNLQGFAATTPNGLDLRYGAGQLNILQSYTLLAAGEKPSTEDGGTGATIAGYDYDSAFGGASGANTTATYPLGTLAQAGRFQATLSWSALIDEDDVDTFMPASRVVHNFDLRLIDTTGGGNTVIASSLSTINNTETLGIEILASRSYRLEVINAHGSPVTRDYALAWRLEADRDRDGLFDKFETSACPGVSDADSDDDGIRDGAEDGNFNGVVDLTETNPCAVDTDLDGLQDGTERGISTPVTDPDGAGPLLGTNTALFVPDANPATNTSATNADTDADGATDGAEDLNRNGAIDPGESDPNDAGSTPAVVQAVPTLSYAAIAALATLLSLIGLRTRSR